MNHVFEHMPNAADHLVWCHKRLVANGLLIIEVPQQFHNHIDRLKRLLGRGGKFNEFSAFSLHHTYFFNAKNLETLIENQGFKVVHLTANVTGPRFAYKKTLRASLVLVACWLANALGNGGDTIEIYARRQ